ncbi:XRE family transcriptional regulator [Flavobacterium sp. GSP27]|uniref:XRE family transcriptional regulator n=1 Tax=Flavobacterium bomense TaxID=2497483 RepID=A0A432CLS5_9FLAO|nr:MULTISPECIES: helix-turn-helix transcriptional regulator [Flavobacterium]RTY94025.1 XRE family transcriptional regulator [Flavobacterium sp. GSN2]RTY67157.1 XRE family transcriptional regulator [Flavobacterium sp. LB2P53]RTY84772.1 XRE family transcriptional regulator [Flavobacterium sp. ZB4P23]RTZ04187.1 XRE family transcriptional regulator [Flavobacterium bomense]RTZ04969.1 XRE family transcriptional regulator [Flavobacterium sp. GSP6]
MNDTSYINWIAMSDNALAQTIGAFVKHHRLSQNKTQEEVAGAANISRSTLSLLEKGGTITVPTLLQVLRVLDLLYIMEVFKIQEQISPIELAKLDQQKRQRARNSDNDSNKKSDW